MEHYFTSHRYVEPIIIKNGSDSNIFWTIIAGVSVFFVGQLLLEFIIKPLREYKNVKNEVFNKLKLYSSIITSPMEVDELFNEPDMFLRQNKNKEEFDKKYNFSMFERYISIAREIRKLSCDLEVKYRDNYKLIRNIFIREKNEDINNAVGCLMRISNSLFDKSKTTSNNDDIDSIKKYLNLV